jgi:hypothetical protein
MTRVCMIGRLGQIPLGPKDTLASHRTWVYSSHPDRCSREDFAGRGTPCAVMPKGTGTECFIG